jgi:hypothetical protein
MFTEDQAMTDHDSTQQRGAKRDDPHVSDPSQDLSLPSIVMDDTPAFATFNDTVYMLYRKNGSQLWYTTFPRYKNATWSAEVQVPNVGLSSYPSAAVFGGRLVVVHTGSAGADAAFPWYVTFDGATWSKDQKVPNVGISASPAVAVYQDKLYLVHMGSGTNFEIWYTTYDGWEWSPDQQVPNCSMSASPALAVFDNKLQIGHQGGSNNGQIWRMTYDGSDWADKQLPNCSMTGSPALAAYTNTRARELYLAHDSGSNQGDVWMSLYNDNDGWSGDSLVFPAGTTWHPPAFFEVSWLDPLYCVVVGPDGRPQSKKIAWST